MTFIDLLIFCDHTTITEICEFEDVLIDVSSLDLLSHIFISNDGGLGLCIRSHNIYMICQMNLSYNIENNGLARCILLIRPYKFRTNEMTIVNNHFQTQQQQSQMSTLQAKALQQFDMFVSKLRQSHLQVIVVQDEGHNDTPDSLYPNNWITFHQHGRYNLYPMFAPNRRLERKIDIFKQLERNQVKVQLFNDYSRYEQTGVYLQGTGSMVLDRKNKIAFAAISPRTNQQLFTKFCNENGYEPCHFQAFHTVDYTRKLIYHTNVMMWIGEGIAAICLESIDNLEQKERVLSKLNQSNRQILDLNEHQINNFAGNVIMLRGQQQNLIVMSERAYVHLLPQQLQRLRKYGKIICSNLENIQKYGGGGARCMIAQIF